MSKTQKFTNARLNAIQALYAAEFKDEPIEKTVYDFLNKDVGHQVITETEKGDECFVPIAFWTNIKPCSFTHITFFCHTEFSIRNFFNIIFHRVMPPPFIIFASIVITFLFLHKLLTGTSSPENHYCT